MKNARAAAIVAQLREAFPAAPLHFAGARTGGLDGGAFVAHVEGKTWEELDAAFLATRSDVLGFLDVGHFVEILPAYLKIFVESGTKTPVPDMLFVVLVRKGQRRFGELVSAFDPDQRAAIVAALDYFAATESDSGTPAVMASEVSSRWKSNGS